MNTRSKGKFFEFEAEKYLVKKNYRIIERNYYYHSWEIDLIALSPNNILVFVEVKFRQKLLDGSDSFNPFDSVSIQKQNNIFIVAKGFLETHPNYLEYYCRYDVIVIIQNSKENIQIHHLQDAFRE